MPTASVSLPPSLASRLNRVRGLTGVSQEALATSAHVAQGTVSSLLSGKSEKPVRANYAQKVVLAVQEAVETHIKSTKPSDDEATELRRPVAEALAFVEGRSEERLRMALPGGAMPLDAKNRVVRVELEKKLQRGLDGHPAMMRIDGPPQSGKSTLLRLVERWAMELGLHVTYADRATRDSDDPEHFVVSLARDMAASWGVEITEEIDSVQGLQTFVRRARRQSAKEPAIVIMDDLAEMPSATQLKIIQMCRVFQNEASHLNLSVLLALEPRRSEGVVNWFWLSKEHFHCYADIDALETSEINKLVEQYPNADQSVSTWIKTFLGGQAYLTHLAIERLSVGQTANEIEKEALQLRGPFGIHLQRLLRTIGGHSPTEKVRVAERERTFLEDMNIFERGSGAGSKPWTSLLYSTFFEPLIEVVP